MGKSDFFIVSKDYPVTQDSKMYLQTFNSGFNQPRIGEIHEEIGRQVVDVIELEDDYPRMIAEAILKDLANQFEWPYFAIVEDSLAFDNGLMIIGYPSEESKQGLDDTAELGCECINVDALKENKVVFESGDEYDFISYAIEHKIGLKGKSSKGVYTFPFMDDKPFVERISE